MKSRGGNIMEIINFEDAKAKRQSKVRKAKQLLETNNSISELQRQYQNDAQFYNQWYDEHVIGQDKDGRWIYKDL